jgi:hypothetical protein
MNYPFKLEVGGVYYYGCGDNNPIKCRLIKILRKKKIESVKKINVVNLPLKSGFTIETNVLYEDELRLTKNEALKNTLK